MTTPSTTLTRPRPPALEARRDKCEHSRCRAPASGRRCYRDQVDQCCGCCEELADQAAAYR